MNLLNDWRPVAAGAVLAVGTSGVQADMPLDTDYVGEVPNPFVQDESEEMTLRTAFVDQSVAQPSECGLVKYSLAKYDAVPIMAIMTGSLALVDAAYGGDDSDVSWLGAGLGVYFSYEFSKRAERWNCFAPDEEPQFSLP